jgi:hypothetical protein
MASGSFELHRQARGPHCSVVFVAATRDEAETRARRWAETH